MNSDGFQFLDLGSDLWTILRLSSFYPGTGLGAGLSACRSQVGMGESSALALCVCTEAKYCPRESTGVTFRNVWPKQCVKEGRDHRPA